MNELTGPEKAFDDSRPVSKRLGIKHLSEREFIRELKNWGVWVGNDNSEARRDTGRKKHIIQALIDRKRQEDGEKVEARAILNSFNEEVMERINALILEGLDKKRRYKRSGALRLVQARILKAEYCSFNKFKKQRARMVKNHKGEGISVRYYSDQLPIAIERLRGMYNSPDIFVA